MRTPALTLLPLVAACAGAGGEGPVARPATAAARCQHEGLDRFIGQTATADLGAQLLEISGAWALRWGAPGMAMTMDFRPDRLTVSYDEKMAITSARCG